MKKLIVAIGLLLLFVSSAFAWEADAMRTQIAQTNFLIVNGDKLCSGTLIDVEHGLILTAAHCFLDDKTNKPQIARKPYVDQPRYVSELGKYFPHNIHPFRILAADVALDLALLRVENLPNTMASQIACTAPKQGDKEYAVGNPFGSLINSVSEGIVSSTERSSDLVQVTPPVDNDLIQITSPIAPGSSGGAIYNDNGKIIGVADSLISNVPTFVFATSVGDIVTFLNEAHIAFQCAD